MIAKAFLAHDYCDKNYLSPLEPFKNLSQDDKNSQI